MSTGALSTPVITTLSASSLKHHIRLSDLRNIESQQLQPLCQTCILRSDMRRGSQINEDTAFSEAFHLSSSKLGDDVSLENVVRSNDGI